MQISEAANGAPAAGAEPCRFPKLEECAHFHYERVQLPQLTVTLQMNMDQSLHSQHTNDEDTEWFMVQVTSGDECWLLQRNLENFQMLDDQLHQCIYDRKISQLPELSSLTSSIEDLEDTLISYLERFSSIADNSVNCGPVLNWLQMDNKGHRLLVPSEESRSINTPAVAAAYSVRRYVSQARDELNLEVGDMISVIDMASPGESMWWRGKRGFQVGFFPQHCVHIIGDKVPRNMPLPPPVVGSLALTPIKPVLRKHGKLITFFRSFILNRPSRRRLKQSGILKERVFGCDLGEHLLNSGHDIPMVLKCCAEFIESHGIVDGIYRLSGVTSNIQKLRNAFDEDRIPNLYTEDILQDIHSVASLLKMYFRELPNPLCTYQLYQSFVNAVQGNSNTSNSDVNHTRLLKMREAVQKLPPPHYRTLEYLTKHLAKVANHGTRTGMTTRNIAIVWAPNLLRCEALEVGGVAALQGVGVQAVVTEFLICYADLIFCDHLPSLDVPLLTSDANILAKKCRPNSLAISTPTKLITLEEARSKHLPNKLEETNNYIEVGGGPKNLPKKYHTVIELPSGARKRGHTKRSPLGWRSLFSKSRNNNQNNMQKNRKASTPITINEKSVTESDLTDMKRKLRSVKSAESLTSGHSEPASNEDILGPLHSLHKPPGHNRSVSHDSYFDTLQNSQNNSEGSLLDLSEIQLNFELEESEMRIFSEDESLVSSPRIQKDCQRRILTRARPEELSSASNSVNPSPKKQARVVLSPDSMSRKRTRLEDQLSDIQYIDCNTPENVVSTTALIHNVPESPHLQVKEFSESYQPKNKSPRNSESIEKRQSLNFEPTPKTVISKSFTEMDLDRKFLGGASVLTTPTPQSPVYKELCESSSNSTPGISPEYQQLKQNDKNSPNYENILTTISITYKSPPRSLATSPIKSPVSEAATYENVILNPERVVIPTSTASLPVQEASQPDIQIKAHLQPEKEERPKSLSALEDYNSDSVETSTLKANLSSSAICNTSEQLSLPSLHDQKTFSSNHSSGSNIQYTASLSSAPYHYIDNTEQLSPSDLSLSEVVHSSTDNLSTSHTSISFPVSPSKISPIVSPTPVYDGSSQDILTPGTPTETRNTSAGISTENLSVDGNLTVDWPNKRPSSVNLIDFSPLEEESAKLATNEKRKSSERESLDDNAIYQQVKYFRRSIHEVNALLDINKQQENGIEKEECNYDSLEHDLSHVYENVEGSSLRSDNMNDYENVDISEKTENRTTIEPECDVVDTPEKLNVRQLTSKFEDKEAVSLPSNAVMPNEPVLVNKSLNNESTNCRLRKFYEKDSLPPCLRARNLKYQFKTRSLDEEEFQKECGNGDGSLERRTSMDESMGYKTNSLPKKLNEPKALPIDDGKLDSIHLAHSTENIANALEEEQKKRERIEKYKEERRKFLHDKYRSESFKEDKDVILSRLRIYKSKEDTKSDEIEFERSTRDRRKSSRSDDSGNEVATDSLDEDNSASLKLVQSTLNQTDKLNISDGSVSSTCGVKKESTKPMTESLKCRAAIFELNQRVHTTDLNRNNNRSSINETKQQQTEKKYAKIVQENKSNNVYGRRGVQEKKVNDEEDVDFIRNKRRDQNVLKEEKRRHTYETRERESETERLRRLSLENRSPRKEKTSPTYCIKDVKAIFESKSKQ